MGNEENKHSCSLNYKHTGARLMSDKWHGGKGDRNRTKDIAKFNENFERIFGAKQRLDKFEKNFAENISKPETTDKEGES